VEKLLLEQIEKMEGPLMEKAEPIIEGLVKLVKAKAYEKTVGPAAEIGSGIVAGATALIRALVDPASIVAKEPETKQTGIDGPD
jgi:hypothetical protein